MRKPNKLLILLISCKEKVCRINFLKKKNMNLYVIFLVNTLMKLQSNFFGKLENQYKIEFFSNKYENSTSSFIFISE